MRALLYQRAPVAQWIRRRPPEAKIASSSLVGGNSRTPPCVLAAPLIGTVGGHWSGYGGHVNTIETHFKKSIATPAQAFARASSQESPQIAETVGQRSIREREVKAPGRSPGRTVGRTQEHAGPIFHKEVKEGHGKDSRKDATRQSAPGRPPGRTLLEDAPTRLADSGRNAWKVNASEDHAEDRPRRRTGRTDFFWRTLLCIDVGKASLTGERDVPCTNGDPARTRTWNLRFRSPITYPLGHRDPD